MPVFERDGASIYYEEHGSGFPVLLIAPGGMRSTVRAWSQIAPMNFVRELASDYRVIAMDQRNAGRSRAPVGDDDWSTYAGDQRALLDHLRVDRFHVIGGCIGCSYALALIEMTGERAASAVLQNPIGLDNGNRQVFFGMVDEWSKELKGSRPAEDPARVDAIGPRMFGGEFVFSVTRDFLKDCRTPMLILPGNDNFHPTATAHEIAALAPGAGYMELGWREPQNLTGTLERVRSFLKTNTP
jgi:pimeloyl-ACP methyl ester carboxylesterase